MLELNPVVDLVTEHVALVILDRPVIGLSALLIDAAKTAQRAGRDIQLLTRRTNRITDAVRTQLLTGPNARWVILTGPGGSTYDGLNGVRLRWEGGLFVQDVAAGVEPDISSDRPDLRAQLRVRARVRPPAGTRLGDAAAFLFSRLAGAPPAGWGSEEPVTQPWNTEALTRFCDRRFPRPTWLCIAGQTRPDLYRAMGSLEARPLSTGLEERITVTVSRPGVPRLRPVVDALASRFGLLSLQAYEGQDLGSRQRISHLLG